jgi:hypothetical protein
MRGNASASDGETTPTPRVQALEALKGASSEQWFLDARFKTFCAKCWDDAKRVCGGFAIQ